MSKRTVAVALLVLGALAAACSGSEKKPEAGISGLDASAAPTSSSSSSSEAATGPSLQVFAAESVPGVFVLDTAGAETIAGGGVSVTFTNGTTVPQVLTVVRIRDADFSSFKAAVLAQGAQVATTLGEVAFTSATVAPGRSATQTATLSAGIYALLSILPAPDGKTFAEHGMLIRLEVTPAAALPTGSAGSESSASSAASGSGSSSSSGSSASQSSSSSSSSSGTPGSSAGSTSSSSP